MIAGCMISLVFIVISLCLSMFYYRTETKKLIYYTQICKGIVNEITAKKIGVSTFSFKMSLSYETGNEIIKSDINITDSTCPYKVGETLDVCYSELNNKDAYILGYDKCYHKPKQGFAITLVAVIVIAIYLFFKYLSVLQNDILEEILVGSLIGFMFLAGMFFSLCSYKKEKTLQKLCDTVISGRISLICLSDKDYYTIAEYESNGKTYHTRPMLTPAKKVDSNVKVGDKVDVRFSKESPEKSIIIDDVYGLKYKKRAIVLIILAFAAAVITAIINI
jgi:hypothetical protein